jgi:hypothetical protein
LGEIIEGSPEEMVRVQDADPWRGGQGEVERLESRWFAKLIVPGPDQRHAADRLAQEAKIIVIQRRGDAQVESHARIGGCGRRPDVAAE